MEANDGGKVAVNAFLIVINWYTTWYSIWCTNYEVSRGGLVYRLGYGLEGPGHESQ